jgi:MFS family permease
MIELLRALFPPIFSLILLILGSGLFGTFVSVRLALEGTNTELIGFVTSAFYAGCLIGAIWSPSWIASTNHLRTMVALSATFGATILLQALWIHPYAWAFLRLISGVALGGLFVVIESWFLLLCTPDLRSRALSIYLIVLYGALSIGQLFLNFVDPYSLTPFCTAGALALLSIIPVTIRTIQLPSSHQTERFSLSDMCRSSPRGLMGGIISGMVLACIYGLVPVYGQEIGLTISEIGFLMSIIVFGGLSLQWPLGKWADRYGRKRLLIFASLGAALFSGMIAFHNGLSWASLLCLSWCFGGFSFVLYPISMAFTCENLRQEQIVAATGGFVLSYGIGAIVGPLLAPLVMSWWGTPGLFLFIAGICIFLAGIGLIPDFVTQKENEP